VELLGRHLRRIDLGARVRQTFAGLRSDYGSTRIALVLLAIVGVHTGGESLRILLERLGLGRTAPSAEPSRSPPRLGA
jgi:hypothetical protein